MKTVEVDLGKSGEVNAFHDLERHCKQEMLSAMLRWAEHQKMELPREKWAIIDAIETMYLNKLN